jgi:hypothetical protein
MKKIGRTVFYGSGKPKIVMINYKCEVCGMECDIRTPF